EPFGIRCQGADGPGPALALGGSRASSALNGPEAILLDRGPLGQSFPASLAEPLLTASHAAGLLAVRPRWVYEAVRDGRLPHVRTGRHVRFLRTDLERFVASHDAEQRAARR